MCEYVGFPAYKWGSNTDVTGLVPGLVCRALEEPLPGTSWRSWATWYKWARLIEELP